MKHVAPHLRTADDARYERFKRSATRSARRSSCRSPRCWRPSRTRAPRKRLREILVGFGPRGAEAVRPLLNAQSWEVRRTAAFLLREFGGAEGLKELVPLLADAEPLVQREAVQGLMLNGSEGSGRHPARAR